MLFYSAKMFKMRFLMREINNVMRSVAIENVKKYAMYGMNSKNAVNVFVEMFQISNDKLSCNDAI